MTKLSKHIHLIVDKSGSMSPVKSDTIGGVNGLISDMVSKDISNTNKYSLVVFSNTFEYIYTNSNSSDIVPLNDVNYICKGSTALCDTWVHTMIGIEAQISVDNDTQHIVVVVTDGLDNTSTKYNKVNVSDYVSLLTDKSVEFIYLGAHEGAISEGSTYGVKCNNTMEFSADKTPEVFRCVTENITSGCKGFTKAQRQQSSNVN